MSTKHTPGPWVARTRAGLAKAIDCTVADIEHAGPYRGDIARLQSAEHIGGIDKGELVANAYLIAAAPDMLEALERCLNFIENTESEHGVMLSCGDLGRAALAKARGEG